jgi:flavin reductase (DIM6/NTAB) family NADH-FMN oxidoreductase RutF
LKDFNIRNANPNTLSGLSIPSVSNANIQQNNEFQINITSSDPQAVGEEISKNNAFQDVVNTVGTTYKNSIIK